MPAPVSQARPATETALSISDVERDTGLPKDTLRVWERRYGFPHPVRDAFGERLYPAEQVERLRLITRLLNQGHRPGRVVPLALADLQGLVHDGLPAPSQASAGDPELQTCLELVKRHAITELRRALHQSALRLGLARFVIDVLGPLNTLVGEAWVRGQIQVFEEHLYTESVTAVLRGAIGGMGSAPVPAWPRVLMTTFPQEQHGLGLLMAETLLALAGCDCVSLGVQTPVPEIVQAARANQAHIVALSFSTSMPGNQVLRGLRELRATLAPEIGIWAGGSHPALARLDLQGVTPMPRLDDIEPVLTLWRATRPAPAATDR